MKKKQYASMQEELAARKAAAGYIEEPRARINASERDGNNSPDSERRRRGIRIWLTVTLVLFVIGLAAAIVIPDQTEPDGAEYAFDETATDEEIIEYIDERWSIDPNDSRKKIKLLSWQYNNQSDLDLGDIGDWTLDVSENFVILRTDYPAYADSDEYYKNCREAVILLQERLQEDAIDGEPVAAIVRQQDGGELMLVVINRGDYYVSPVFEQ